MAIGLLSLAGKGLSALGKRRAAKKEAQATTGKQVAENITGKKVDKSQNPRISFGHDSSAMSSAVNISESTGRSTRTATTPDGVAVQIETKTINLKDALRRSLILDKEREKGRKVAIKKGKRTKAEEDAEKGATKGGKFSLPLPGAKQVKSLWERIKDFFLTILWGRIAFLLIGKTDLLEKVLPKIGAALDWVIDAGIKFLDIAGTALQWGYAAYDWTRGVVGKVFGEEGVRQFDRISGLMNKMLQLTVGVTLAMIAFSNEFGSNLIEWGKGFMSLFKHGLKRAIPRLLIKIFGKKTAASILGKSVVAKTVTGTTVAAGGGGTAATTAATVGGVGAGVAAAAVAAAGGLAVGLGEGVFALGKKGYAVEEDWKQKADSKAWWDPRKWWWGIGAGMLAITNRVWSLLGGIFDIIGAPFRMLGELIMFPFLSEEGKKKQKDNLVKYDTRIREQFRKWMNMFDIFGVVSDDEGSWGSIYGDKASAKASKDLGFTGSSDSGTNTAPINKEAEQISTNKRKEGKGSDKRGKGSKLAGELGRFLDRKGLGKWGAGVHRHPEHPPWDPESGHRVGSLHYQSQGARAIDIGGWGPDTWKSKGYKGVDDQTKIIEGIRAFEQSKGGLKRAEFAHEGNEPTGHWNHVHVAYHKGGEVPGTGERMARLLGGETVIDVDSSGPAKDMLLAINKANSYEGVVDAIRKFAPYEAMAPETITIPDTKGELEVAKASGAKGSVEILPFFMSNTSDPFEILYKG